MTDTFPMNAAFGPSRLPIVPPKDRAHVRPAARNHQSYKIRSGRSLAIQKKLGLALVFGGRRLTRSAADMSSLSL
jgi:hypothetical protein